VRVAAKSSLSSASDPARDPRTLKAPLYPVIVVLLPLHRAFWTRATAVSARVGPPELALGLALALTAVIGTIGADARWLPALGQAISEQGKVPRGVPFAAAPSADWPNVPVLAELVLHWLTAAGGDRGLLLAQLVAVAGGLAFLVVDMRRGGANDASAGLVIILIVVGALPALLVIRSQLFSLLLFPLLVTLLREEKRAPSRRVWLVPLLLALWSNLHGAVLVGLGVAGIYLVLSRAHVRPLESAAVVILSTLAVCATPALERTPAYYAGVLQNEAARRGEGLWAPLSLSSGFDLLLLASGIVLVALAVRERPSLWELVALTALAIMTVRTARSGVWLLFFAGPLAARPLRLRAAMRPWPALVIVGALIVYGLARGPVSQGASERVLDDALRLAGGTPILADGIPAEQVALAGGRVWMSNPLDAFDRQDQKLYLDWLDGRPNGARAIDHAPRVVLVSGGSDAGRLVAGRGNLRAVAADDHVILYVRRNLRSAEQSTERVASGRLTGPFGGAMSTWCPPTFHATTRPRTTRPVGATT
jgi:hypothetical protein